MGLDNHSATDVSLTLKMPMPNEKNCDSTKQYHLWHLAQAFYTYRILATFPIQSFNQLDNKRKCDKEQETKQY